MALLKDLTVFGATRLVLDTIASNIYSDGFHHNEHNNDDHVLLAGGGHIAITTLLSGGFWANQSIQNATSTTTEPQFGSVGINTAVNSNYKLNVSGASRFNGIINIDSNSIGAKTHINFNRTGFNYINIPTNGTFAISVNDSTFANSRFTVDNTSVCPGQSNGTITLGTSSYRWYNMYSKVINMTTIDGTNTAAVTSSPYKPMIWTFNANITPQNGDIITIKTPGAGHDYGVFLSTNNGTNYYPITLNSNTRLTTQYVTGSYLTLLFDSSNSAASMFPLEGGSSRVTVNGGTWRVVNYYDSGFNEWNLRQYNIKAATAIKGVHIIGGTDSGYNDIDSGTSFDIRYPVLYAGSNISATQYGNNNFIHHYSINIKDSSENNISFTAYKNVYIKGTITDTTFTPISGGNPYVQNITEEDDGYVYYYIGRSYSTSGMTFDGTGKDIYVYKNNAIQRWSVLDGYHANEIESIYSGGWCSGIGTYWGKVAEYKYNGSSTIDVTASFLLTRYYTSGNPLTHLLAIRCRGTSKSDASKNITASYIYKTNTVANIPVAITHIYNSTDGYYYIRIYIKSAGWGETYGIKLLNTHNWSSPIFTRWVLYNDTYTGHTVETFTSLPSDETEVTINSLDLYANIIGNASTATTWKTARTLTIGNAGKSVNGSANVSWSLAEIGAATSDHTHTFASITSKITSSNEFNFVDVEAASIWINRKRANNIIASTLTTNFSFGVGDNTATYAYLTAEGFKKNGSSDSYVLLGNGGHKLLTELKDIDTITITKSLTITEAWMDTGIITNATTFTQGDGTYVIQISKNNTLLYSGIIAIMTSGITGTDTEEVVLHCARKSNYQRLYIRTQNTDSGYAKIQIAAETNYSSAQSLDFKFRKLI